MTKKRIFITGGSGFIGKRLIENLSDDNEYFILTRKAENFISKSNLTFVKGALEDLANISQQVKNIDIIVHLAAEISDESKMDATNVSGVLNLCSFAKETGVKKMVHLSSVGVIGKQYSFDFIVVDEETKCSPMNYYEKTKLKSEEILLDFTSKNQIDLLVLRPTNVFGDGHPRKVLLHFISRIAEGKKVPYSKNALVNYVFVEDLVQIILAGLKTKLDHKIYLIGQPLTLSEFTNQISQMSSGKSRIIQLPNWIFIVFRLMGYLGSKRLKQKFHAISNKVSYDGSKIVQELGLNYNLTLGLRKTIAYYKQQGLKK